MHRSLRSRGFKWLLGGLAAVVVTVLAARQACLMRMGALTAPFVVSDTVAMSDGGTMWLTLHDAGGRKLMLWRRGSMDVPAVDQPLYVTCWFGVIPVPWPAPKGSQLEADAKRALRTWLAGKLPPTQEAALAQGDAAAFRNTQFDVIGAYAFATWIESRSTR